MEEIEFDESLDELRELELEGQHDLEELEDLETEEDEVEEPLPPKKPKKPRKLRKKIVIPPDAHPLEAFMIAKEFEWGHLAGITKLSKEELLDIIRGDMPSEYQRQRIRLTTGVRL